MKSSGRSCSCLQRLNLVMKILQFCLIGLLYIVGTDCCQEPKADFVPKASELLCKTTRGGRLGFEDPQTKLTLPCQEGTRQLCNVVFLSKKELRKICSEKCCKVTINPTSSYSPSLALQSWTGSVGPSSTKPTFISPQNASSFPNTGEGRPSIKVFHQVNASDNFFFDDLFHKESTTCTTTICFRA